MLRSLIAFEEAVIPFHTAALSKLSGKISPSGLMLVALSGNLLINNSPTIAEYLAELYHTSGLWLEHAAARARYERGGSRNAFRLWCTAVGFANESPLGAREPRVKH